MSNPTFLPVAFSSFTMSLSKHQKLLVEILSRLPIKDLLRFKSVCKPWYQLITKNSHFAQLQHTHSTKSQENSIIILTKLNHRSIRSYSFCSADIHDLDFPKKMVFPFDDNLRGNDFHCIVSSCNGILCFAIFCNEYIRSGTIIPKSSFFLWNPSTNDHLTVPCLPIPDEHKEHIRKKRYFDPKYGFGFHPVSIEYKLVRILGFHSLECNSQVSVYTLGGNGWRVLGYIPFVVKSAKLCNTLVNGALHWAAKGFGSKCWDFILSFDIKDEQIRQIQLPSGVSSHLVENEVISELGGFLCYTYMVKGTEEVHVWVMKEYDVVNSWTEQYVVELPEVENWSDETYVEPLGMVNEEEVLFGMGGTLHMFVYNPRCNSIRKLSDDVFLFRQIYPHVRSLIWPKVSKGDIATKRKRG